MHSTKKLKIYSLAGFASVIGTVLGFLLGLFYAFGGLLFEIWTTASINAGTILAFLALIGMPLIFGTAFFLLALLLGIIYYLLKA